MTVLTRATSVTESADTIVAISTPPGEGGVGIVRLSGPRAFAIAEAIFVSAHGRALRGARQRVFHGHVQNAAGETLDEVLLHCMPGPRSYTREDVAEINAHGGAAPLQAILEACLQHGARLARPGEFTQRAFLNGRIDLVQAEAVMDLIQARTQAGMRAAQAAASGVLSKEIHRVQHDLAESLARVEAALDFPDEDLPELVDEALFTRLGDALATLNGLIETAQAGRLCREGAAVAIVGRPNAGKSSLFNALLRDARAIVSPHPGTTRDRIEEYINLGGIPVKLVDTAGLRHTGHDIERIGVELAREAMQTAHALLWVVDASAPDTPEDRALAEEISALNTPVTVAFNKSDLAPGACMPQWPFQPAAAVPVSALTGEGIAALEEVLGRQLLGDAHLAAGQAMLTRAHQTDSVRRAAQHLERLLQDTSLSPEFLALDLRETLRALGEITGETTPEDLLDMVFSTFCIGK